jgi:hypothetical protein
MDYFAPHTLNRSHPAYIPFSIVAFHYGSAASRPSLYAETGTASNEMLTFFNTRQEKELLAALWRMLPPKGQGRA